MAIDINLMEIILSLSGIIDLAEPQVNRHHERTAYIARKMAEKAGMEAGVCDDIYTAGLLHDCGALSLKEKLKTLEFDARLERGHSEVGYRLLKPLKYFSDAADIIRYHHVWWNNVKKDGSAKEKIPEESFMLHLADRVDVLTDRNRDILEQAGNIRAQIAKESGRMFEPEMVDIFLKLSEDEDFWKGISQADLAVAGDGASRVWTLEEDEVVEIANLFIRIIDFRSRFTATHSRGVAAVAWKLAECMRMEEQEVFRIRLAGSLHDIGKLGVPLELLEKRGSLTYEEFEKVKRHAFLTYDVLNKVKCLEFIKEDAAFHHEKLDGTGYPFGLREGGLPASARIIAVSDMFTAMMEDRPYRKGMSADATLNVLKEMGGKGKLDREAIEALESNIDVLMEVMKNEQTQAAEEYAGFRAAV